MARARRKKVDKSSKKKIVRGADGGLYLLSGGKAPKKLTPNEARKLTKILQDAENDLVDTVKKQIPSVGDACAVFILLPEVE